ncbi:deoxyribodipyrimidine photo-lyase [Kordiimonas sediminis]|uniref:Deoxyribodipyrimidine photo-lyase n=2 Tax=Kordiimonas sediminis TaxID=1735581 RepID=A0A919E8H9_9PROT|nr:deoxyribodipyrimidine photo-lyase [Kordiimonas sediminis]
MPVFILDDAAAGEWSRGSASRAWLHASLKALNEALGGKLATFKGSAEDIIPRLVKDNSIKNIHWNRCYEPWRIDRDMRIKDTLHAMGCTAESHNGSLLWEPWEVQKPDGSPYKVFTPFYKKASQEAAPPARPLPRPDCNFIKADGGCMVDELSLLPKTLDWADTMMSDWEAGEEAAFTRLQEFLEDGLTGYKTGRNFPARANVSRLSPYLHFGEISPRTVWYAALNRPASDDRKHFLSELGWREFSYYLLYHFPTLPRQNFQPKFDAFPWGENEEALKAWQQGQTGFPIIDAGMRELWQTGYMHNRVRMIVASFLVKNLLIDWRHGEDWFWDCLVDADLANNSASWQWVAGSGADAAPYFRIFNPVSQSEKFDLDGSYIRTYVPELQGVPAPYIHTPWTAPKSILTASGVTLGETYPEPICDLALTRSQALAAYQTIKGT